MLKICLHNVIKAAGANWQPFVLYGRIMYFGRKCKCNVY